MTVTQNHCTTCLRTLLITLSLIVLSSTCFSQDDITGWEKGSEYDNLYNPKERDQLRGVITKFLTITPLPDMVTGTAFLLEEAEDEMTLIHLCPESFAKAKETGLKKGSKVKVKGSWAEIDDEFIFLASKVKRGDHFEFKVRLTSDGTPFWTMSPEQLSRERSSK